MYSPAAGMFGLCSHFLPTVFIAAKMSKENVAACTNKEKKLMETEKQSTQNTVDDANKQASVAVSAQSTSSEEDHKPQTPKEEEKPTEEERGTNEEEKGEDKKMEVDPCSETAASGDEKGKCLDKAEDKDPSSPSVQPVTEEPIPKDEQSQTEESAAPKPYYDVVNVSEGFQLRTAYKKKVKPSKLDGLLERRVKQFTLEEKQRLERMRQAALLSKMAPAKPASTVKTEGSTLGKQQSAAALCVKQEKDESLQVKDHVVKKLNFEQEKMEVKADNLDVKSDITAPNHSKQMEVNAVQGNGAEVLAHKEVNGGPLANAELNSKNNCISDTIESKEKTQKSEVAVVGESAKKRGYEEMEQGSRQSNTDSAEVDQSKTNPVQMNGKAGVPTATDSSVDSDAASGVQGDAKDPQKEPVKSLMNGNLSQNDVSDMCHPPPLKVPKLENHVAEKGDTLNVNEKEGTVPVKPPSSSLSCLNSNSADNNSSEGLKTTAESQNAPQSDVTSQAAGSTISSVTPTTQPTSKAVVPQKTKVPVTDTKMGTSGSTTTSSMISKEYSTRDRVSLLRFSKSKKARSGTALPSYRKFVTKSSKKSIFILPNDDLKRLARRASIREVPIFNYNAKPAPDIWPYPSPRPTFGITWRLVTHLDLVTDCLGDLKDTLRTGTLDLQCQCLLILNSILIYCQTLAQTQMNVSFRN